MEQPRTFKKSVWKCLLLSGDLFARFQGLMCSCLLMRNHKRGWRRRRKIRKACLISTSCQPFPHPLNHPTPIHAASSSLMKNDTLCA